MKDGRDLPNAGFLDLRTFSTSINGISFLIGVLSISLKLFHLKTGFKVTKI
jgi:hypothetical protein